MRLMTLVALLLPACSEFALYGEKKPSDGDSDSAVHETGDSEGPTIERTCPDWDFSPEAVGLSDSCPFGHTGTFNPIIEWEFAPGDYNRSTVAVGDLDGDGVPEIVATVSQGLGILGLLFGVGELWVERGDGSGLLWKDEDASIGFASPPAIGDLDDDGYPEIVVAREYDSSFFAVGDYVLAAYDYSGAQIWESEHFTGDDFDYATAVHISDMDHDGSPEVIAGRVILNADGSTRGVGAHGRGCYGQTVLGGYSIDESSVSAVADLDLDGTEELIVGDARYSPDGDTLFYDASADDAMIGVANLDDDPEGEVVAITGNTVRAIDTDGSVMWGPTTIPGANILAPPAIDDIDGDGEPEIITAGGNHVVAYNADGSVLWTAAGHDETGASGASIFDFEGDGQPEVAYIDEIEMLVFDGATGAVKFSTDEHASDTMFDYPVIADVDADGQAEVIFGHVGGTGYAVSIYGDEDESWAPARDVWNQHAYCISNINDDLSVPTTATPSFSGLNSWHSAWDPSIDEVSQFDLESELLGVCQDDCDQGVLFVAGAIRNKSAETLPAGSSVALYVVAGGSRVLADTATTSTDTPSGYSSETLEFEVDADLARTADLLWLEADDDGTGVGAIDECEEDNNSVTTEGPFCE